MKYLIVVVIVICITHSSFAQSDDTHWDQLSRSTVLLDCVKRVDGKLKAFRGTGFLIRIEDDTLRQKTILVTNRHVIEGATRVYTTFSTKDRSGNNNPKQKYKVDLDKGTDWMLHPDDDVDLAAMEITKIINDAKAKGVSIHTRQIDVDLIQLDDDVKYFRNLQDVYMIGYPRGIIDTINNLPLSRRGVLGMNPIYDYKGKKDIVVDIVTLQGSSGSPIFAEEKLWQVNSNQIIETYNLKLIGILRASHMYKLQANGTYKMVVENCTDIEPSTTKLPMNLGLAVKASALKPFIAKFGFK